MDIKELFKKILTYGGGNVATALSSFILLPIYIRNMTVEEYGILSLALVIPILFNVLMTLSLEGSVMRFYYEWQEKEVEKKSIFTVWLFMVIWAALITIFLILIGDKIFSIILTSIPFDPYIRLAILSSFVAVTFNIVGKILRIKEEATLYVIINYVATTLRFLLIIYFVVYLKMNAEGALYGILIANIIMLIPNIYILFKNCEFSIRIDAIIESLKLELPLIPGQILTNALSILDRILLEKFVSLSDVGIFMIARKIASLIMIIVNMFQLALAPHYIKLHTQVKNAKEQMLKLNNLFFDIVFLCTLVLMFFAPEIMVIIGKEETLIAAKYIPFISIGLYLQVLLFGPSMQFLIGKKLIYSSYASIIKFVLFVGISFVLAPVYGIDGIIVSIIVSNLVVLIFSNYYGERVYPLKGSQKNFNSYYLLVSALIILCLPDIFRDIDIQFFIVKLLVVSSFVVVYIKNIFQLFSIRRA
jgi:O-antigen/teichoic acid export membrane protein